MGKLHDFLMGQETAGEVTTEVQISQFPFPFLINSITDW